jgi:hypothetical protein
MLRDCTMACLSVLLVAAACVPPPTPASPSNSIQGIV